VIRPPPKVVRRVVLAPLVVLVCAGLVVLSPVLLAGAALLDVALRGRGFGVTRLVAFSIVYLAAEAAMIVAFFLLWIGSVFGVAIRSELMRSAHFAVIRAWLHMLSAAGRTLLGLRIVLSDPPEPRPGPLLVFGRHAGIGNSLMMVRQLMLKFGRTPRVVMLEFLAWDPVIDILAHRLDGVFISHRPDRGDERLESIAGLASGMGEMDAFVLYPEGKDFTEPVKARAVTRLRDKGHVEHAERAEAMERVLPPRHRGPLAAILAAPEADVVLVAHTALEELGSLKDLHRRLPLMRPVLARYWRIPAAEVPRERDALIAWLFDWWERIDAWIVEQSPVAESSRA
jgi:hypothetical protein